MEQLQLLWGYPSKTFNLLIVISALRLIDDGLSFVTLIEQG
ncbi:hypothetical protein [Acinetobacter sp. YH12254]|nr:hypothetical protein [Acinetobacter sp. YH12254]